MKNKLIIGSVVVIVLIIIILSLFRGENPTIPDPITNLMATPTVSEPVTTQAVVVTENLENPWGMVFLPNGSMMVTERTGRVRLIEKNGILQFKPIAVLREVKEVGDGGLRGIAIDPVYSVNNFVFVYYTYSVKRNATFNRVLRMKFYNGELTEDRSIIDNIPGSINNNGGSIKFGPDDLLYVATGDTENPSTAQDPNSLAGKILRVNDEGKPAPGNPFGAGSIIYSYGHHNPQGLAWDRWDIWAKLWMTDYGTYNPAGFDEIDLINSGKNYGWPFVLGDQVSDGVVQPLTNSGASESWGPGGAAFAGSSLFFGGSNKQVLYEAVIEDGKVKKLKEHFKGKYGPIHNVVLGPDNMIYFSTDDKIYKVDPVRILD